MAPTPPDPHVRNRKPGLIVIIAAIVVILGLIVVFHDKPGAGMGGSLNGPDAQADSR
jgi:preprotein translocase subunit SecG